LRVRRTRRIERSETLARYGSLNLAGKLGFLPSLIEVSRLAAATIAKAGAATLTLPCAWLWLGWPLGSVGFAGAGSAVRVGSGLLVVR